MSEKKPVKRGVLSGLMGLFGDEEAAGQVVGSAPVAAEDEDPAFSPQATPVAQNIDDSGGAAPRPSEVVREAYEPGWYRISAAMSVGDADDEDDEDEENEEEERPGEVEVPVEELFGPEAPPAEAVTAEAPAAEYPAVEAVTEEPVAVEPAAEEPVAIESPGEETVPVEPAEVEFEPAEPFAAAVADPPGAAEPVTQPERVVEPLAEEPAVSAQDQALEPAVEATDAVATPTFEDPAGGVASTESLVHEASAVLSETAPPSEQAEQPRDPYAESPSDVAASGDGAMQQVSDEPGSPPDVEGAVVVPPADEGPHSRLQSRDVATRREGVMAIARAGVGEEDVPPLLAMVQDPDRDIRVLVLQTLTQRPDLVDVETVRVALRDPVDQVRSAAIRLAAARPETDVPDVFAVAAERHWPLSQQVALEVLPELAARAGIDDEGVRALLVAVGNMDSQPVPAEHEGLSALARALGPERLAGRLSEQGPTETGAARLLLEDGSNEALSPLAQRSTEESPEIAFLIEQARDRIAEAHPHPAPEEMVEQPSQDQEEASQPEQPGPDGEDEMLVGLARALEDPDEGVRQRARDAFASLDRAQLSGWVVSALDSDDGVRAALGAAVAGSTGLQDMAPRVLERAVSVAPEVRPAFVRALSALGATEQIQELAASSPPEVRPDAIRVLWQVVGRAMLGHVPALLEDSSAHVRLAALEVIAESGDPSSIDLARGALERDSSPMVRATAIQVIGRAGLEQREASLQKALADPDPDVRATAVELLVSGLGGQATHILLRALSDGDERVWRAAARSLSDVPDHDRGVVWTAIVQCPLERREELLVALERTSKDRVASLALEHLMSLDPQERTLAVVLAGRSGTPEAVRGLSSALQDPAAPVRRAAASALATLRRPSAIPGLAGSLYDPDVEVRVEAVRGLSEIDDDDVLDPLINALKDPEVRVREVAGQALVKWRSPAVAKRLVIGLGDPSLRRSAGEVLAQMGAAAVDPLVDLLRERGSEVAASVGQLLRDLVGPDLFLERLGSMDPEERLRAAEALGAIGGETGLDGLARALSDPVEGIRIRAVTLMGDSRDPRAFEAVKRTFMGDPVQEVVAAAEEALQKLQPGTSS